MVQEFRFRGGVRFTPDDGKWHIIIELNGTQYLESTEYDTEEEAMVVYKAAREEILKNLNGIGIVKGSDLEFENIIKCTWCQVLFKSFEAYNSHIPCAKAGGPEIG